MGFLSCEALLVARLEAYVAAADWTGRKAPRVFKDADAAAVEERAQLAPAYFVVFEGHAPTQETNAGRVQQINQHWAIYASLRNARRHGSAQGVRDDADALMELALRALCGWVPSSEFAPLRMIESPGPVYSDAGFGYFALRFETRCVVRGDG